MDFRTMGQTPKNEIPSPPLRSPHSQSLMGADPSYSFVSDTPLALKVASEQQALHKEEPSKDAGGSPQPDVPDPRSRQPTLPWVPQSDTWDDAAQIAASQRLNRAAVLATSGATGPPFPTHVAANASNATQEMASFVASQTPMVGPPQISVGHGFASAFNPAAFDSPSTPPEPLVAPLEGRLSAGRASGRASMSVRPGAIKPRTKVGRAVIKNSAEIDLIGVSLIALIDDKIESLRREQERLNSEESRAALDRAILDWSDLKRKVEAFLESVSQFAAKQTGESAVTEKTYSLVDGVRDWWSRRHVQICDKLFDKALQASDVALFGTVLGLCGLAGVEPNLTVAISGTWFGGKGVADVIKATLTGGKVPTPRSKKGRR